MFLQRSATAIARRTPVNTLLRRSFATSVTRRHVTSGDAPMAEKKMKKLEEITSEEDLLPPGAAPGTVPTDMEQATGLERLEILGKMEGVDIFDMQPLDASRLGTLDNPIVVKSFGEEQYAGCTGFPADSHNTLWLVLSRDRPIGRCSECGNVLKMQYVGPEITHDEHTDGEHSYEEPKTFADYVRPEYRGFPPGYKDAC